MIRTNSLQAWLLAARPKTLSGAAVPVMIGIALTYAECGNSIRLVPALLCLLFAFIMQIDANFVNDYFDFLRGNDGPDRLGPLRACSQGWITGDAMKKGILFTTALACTIGLPLVAYGGWTMIGVGALCVVFCFLYTTHLSYIGMGDLLVLLFFGLVPVTMTRFLTLPARLQSFSYDSFAAALACGLVVDTLLVVNNYRDIENDLRDGKRTLIVFIGSCWGERLYLGLGLAACALCGLFWLKGWHMAAVLPLAGYLPFHIATYRELCKIGKGRALNRVLGSTARNIFIFGLLLSAGLLLSRLL